LHVMCGNQIHIIHCAYGLEQVEHSTGGLIEFTTYRN